MSDDATAIGWAVVELMGHRRLAGYVREQQVAGVGFLRLDVPDEDGGLVASQLYSPSAIYCITPTTEEIARGLARTMRPEPVHRWELPARAAPETPASDGDDEEPW